MCSGFNGLTPFLSEHTQYNHLISLENSKLRHISPKLTTIIIRIPQGSLQGPVLFNLHIHDIDCEVPHASFTKYADDTLVVILAKALVELCSQVLLDLNDWFIENSFQFNLKKKIRIH